MSLPINIALLTRSINLSLGDLLPIAAALQKQMQRDVVPAWGMGPVTVAAFENAPLGYFPITVLDKLDEDGVAGYHDTENGQPYALVSYDEDVSLTLSHELIEMYVDPFGSRFVPAWHDGKRVKILVEACDPVEDKACAYTVDGVVVSDFVFPIYYDTAQVTGRPYCFSGRVDGPRQIQRGGYFSWLNEGDEWWQRQWFGYHPATDLLGKLDLAGRNPRATIDALTRRRKKELYDARSH